MTDVEKLKRLIEVFRSANQEVDMTDKQCITVLEMVEAHGGLVIEAKDRAMQALKERPELEAYRAAREEIRQLPIAWEEGAGILKCINIIDRHLKEAQDES